jgi:hypothetical protein
MQVRSLLLFLILATGEAGCSRAEAHPVPVVSTTGHELHTYPYLEAELPPGVFSGLEAEVDREKLFAVLMSDAPGVPIEAGPLKPRAWK